MIEIRIPVNEILEQKHQEEGFSTTFWQDFSIAEAFGFPAVTDTYRQAFTEWRHDYRYLTDLVMTLNHKIFQWYEKDEDLARLYNTLWEEASSWAEENLTGEALSYYYRLTD